MGNTQNIQKINFEDIQTAIKQPERFLIINTLPITTQNCLIVGTIPASQEELTINKYLKENNRVPIIIYGRHCNDPSIHTKYQQLLTLGFTNVYIYFGGLFEWVLLQNVYGDELFPTTVIDADILKLKPPSLLNIPLLKN